MPSEFDEVVNEIEALIKELNLQAVKNTKDDPIFKDLLIGLELSDSDIETDVQNCSTAQDNSLVHNAVVKAVTGRMDTSAEVEEQKSEAQEFESAYESLVYNKTVNISADKCAVELSLKNLRIDMLKKCTTYMHLQKRKY